MRDKCHLQAFSWSAHENNMPESGATLIGICRSLVAYGGYKLLLHGWLTSERCGASPRRPTVSSRQKRWRAPGGLRASFLSSDVRKLFHCSAFRCRAPVASLHRRFFTQRNFFGGPDFESYAINRCFSLYTSSPVPPSANAEDRNLRAHSTSSSHPSQFCSLRCTMKREDS